ncbi:hypothetical protein [Polaribacter sp. Asnod6-C07]|uniref:hypothetical protein n=1 Tax=Polaribacter sp. Asnod6-C07 TaxID=3160582 RepID=UPI003868A5EE
MKKITGILLIISSLFSCKNSNIESIKFEKKLLSKIKENGKKFIESKEKKYLDFKELTEFEWDFFKYVSGNESVPVLKDEIKCDLNLGFETSDLNINKSRFYFFKNNKFIKELEISHNDKVHFHFSNYCSEKEYYENKFIATNNSEKFENSETILHPFCESRIYKSEQLIEYYDYKFLVSSLVTKDKGKTYEYNIAEEKLTDSIGIGKVFNKKINNENGAIKISFDIITDRTNKPKNFIFVKENKILINPNFSENCYKNSGENEIFHCEYEFLENEFKSTEFEIKTTHNTV